MKITLFQFLIIKLIYEESGDDSLLIDDLFKGKITEVDINIVFEILNYRYLDFLPLIVSTECTVDKLLEIDEAMGSRIYEMSKDYLVEIRRSSGNNYRMN